MEYYIIDDCCNADCHQSKKEMSRQWRIYKKLMKERGKGWHT